MKEVVNLSDFNSEFDDYNSTLPANRFGEFYLAFSSKREKKQYFNLVGFHAALEYNENKNYPYLVKSTNGNLDFFSVNNFVPNFEQMINGDFNVLGPFVINKYNLITFDKSPKYEFLFYADDEKGRFDIKTIFTNTKGLPEKVDLDYLNSEKNDAYPFVNFQGNEIYFCSDRNGDFDIFHSKIGENETTYQTDLKSQILSPKNPEIKILNQLSIKGYDDKCPFLYNENLLIFTSNRPGGFGGFDIYYCNIVNGGISNPINAGPRINTEYDEYRPIIPFLTDFNYPLMIFSSNRPGGKGGFDLYMTGLLEQ